MKSPVSCLSAIGADNLSGSSEILQFTIDGILQELNTGSSPSEIKDELSRLCERFPAMALLQNLLAQLNPLTVHQVMQWEELYRRHEESACRHFANYLSKFRSILVHSNSGMLRRSIQLTNSTLDVYCTESRPAFEGRILAEKLSQSTDHRIHLIPDFNAFEKIGGIDLMAFGADALTKKGIINKIGTAALAHAAKAKGRDCFFVATTEKQIQSFDEAALKYQGNRDEVYPGPEPLLVQNIYFDLTPRELISGVFLEDGLASDW